MGNLIGLYCGNTSNGRFAVLWFGVRFGRVDVGLDAMRELVEVMEMKLVDEDEDNRVPDENNKSEKRDLQSAEWEM